MFDEKNSVVALQSKSSFQIHGTIQRINCLLCRVLWPRSLQHRHVLCNALEAKTIIHKTRAR